jgi:MerR family transcriptional regulator, light-induced transcriptional regulator
MDESALFASELIAQSATGLAALSAEQLLSFDPGLAARYAPSAAIKWRESISTRLGYLSTALRTGEPEVFVSQMGWAKISVHARLGEQGVRDLLRALGAKRQVLASELPPAAATCATTYLDAALRGFEDAPSQAPARLSVNTPHGRLAAEFLLGILEGDRARACELVLTRVRAGDLSVREAYVDVILPVQGELGRLWHMNESSVAEEHFATTTTQMLMSQLYPLLVKKPRHGKVVLAASVEGNAHDIGLRMVADMLEADGWRAVYLGASVPPEELRKAVIDFKVDLVALSAGIATHLPVAQESIALIRKGLSTGDGPVNGLERRIPKIMVGGGAFAELGSGERAEAMALRIGADGHAFSLEASVKVAAQLCAIDPR